MNPGELRDLDRLMAERIMGWHQAGALVSGETEPRLAWEAGRIPQLPLNQWHPTERIDQAWMVASVFRAKGYMVTLDLYQTWAWVTIERAGRIVGVGHGEDALAICLAAKATTEGER